MESMHDGIDKLYEFIRARSRIFGHGWTSTGDEATGSAPSATSKAAPASSQESTESTTYGREGFRKRFQQQQETADDLDLEIDPITNRRLPKKPQNSSKIVKNPAKTFEGYRSQFQKFEPPASTEEPTSPEIVHSLKDRLKGYRRVGVEQSESPDPIQEGLKSYDEKVDYESRRFYDCEGIAVDYSDPVQNGLRDYDNKISDGKACPESSATPIKNLDPVQDGLADYDVKAGYRPSRPSERIEEQPRQPDPVSQAFEDYVSRTERPTIVQSSDSKLDPLDPVEQAIRDYEGSNTFKQAQKKKEGEILLKAIQYYEANFKHDPTKLTGRRLDAEELNPVLEAMQTYESATTEKSSNADGSQEPLNPFLKACREYQTSRASMQAKTSSPDASREHLHQPQKCPVQEGLKEYDAKVNNYEKPTSGRRTVESLAFASTPSTQTGLKGIPEDTTEDLDLLRTSDVRAASGIIKSSPKETESQKSAKRRQLEDSFESVQKEQSSIDEAAAANKVHASRKLAEELQIEQSELLNHVAHARGRVNAKIAEVEAGWAPQTPEKKKITGNFVRDFPEEFEAKWTNTEASTEGLTSKSEGQEKVADPLVGLAPESFSRIPGTPRIQTSLDRSNSPKTGSSAAAQESTSPKPVSAVASSQGRSKSKADHLARNEQRLKERDLVREVRGIYEDEYGTIDSKHRQVPVPEPATVKPKSTTQPINSGQTIDPSVKTPEPTLYKILAYDPTMQSVSTASTTSIVPDSSDILTPAEVLLRLSNPSKFFPHFASLQSQGYEIVAGSGDVLVFRKVRSGSPILSQAEVKEDTPSEAHAKAISRERKRVTNPIDGMQSSSPITGDFASPTGFVNYDRHSHNHTSSDTEMPFKSNIDVRREEPVFSGRRNWDDEEGEEKPKNKSGKGKRLLVGAAWVAGCSYAVGVVSEFFRTGGVDGQRTRMRGFREE
ncbi:hypothetical protein VTL71DRAFT_7250 [Oculimacula yallundae]|uniref:Uncharacterized protein n=1 Tax=Oculimacula yallundae TaxID=86028 RepID=A0ABR4BWW8_9HELO